MHFPISNQKTGRNQQQTQQHKRTGAANHKREAHQEIQIEFNSICPINFPVFVSVLILFPGSPVQIPRVKVVLV